MFDFTFLSLGAGVQSGTLAEMIVKSELPRIEAAIFADTGDEPDYVYDYVAYLTERLTSVDIPLWTVQNGNIVDDLQGHNRFATIPLYTVIDGKIGKLKRQCTSEYKIEPIEKAIKEHLLRLGFAVQKGSGIFVDKSVQVYSWLGLSLDEVNRMKPNPQWWITNQWPLVDRRMSRLDCVNWLEARNLPVPKKSSCRICPYHNDNYWRDMRDNRPEDWQHAIKLDKFFRSKQGRFSASVKGELFLHKQCVPLDEVDLSTQVDKGQLELWDACDEGYCFV